MHLLDTPDIYLIIGDEEERLQCFAHITTQYRLRLKVVTMREAVSAANDTLPASIDVLLDHATEMASVYGKYAVQTIKKVYGTVYAASNNYYAVILDADSWVFRDFNLTSLVSKHMEEPIVVVDRPNTHVCIMRSVIARVVLGMCHLDPSRASREDLNITWIPSPFTGEMCSHEGYARTHGWALAFWWPVETRVMTDMLAYLRRSAHKSLLERMFMAPCDECPSFLAHSYLQREQQNANLFRQYMYEPIELYFNYVRSHSVTRSC